MSVVFMHGGDAIRFCRAPLIAMYCCVVSYAFVGCVIMLLNCVFSLSSADKLSKCLSLLSVVCILPRHLSSYHLLMPTCLVLVTPACCLDVSVSV